MNGWRATAPGALLSFGVLAFQLYIPWSAPHLVTQDGPAHIYTAYMVKDLVFHRHSSPYHAVYHVQKSILPNWTCTLLLSGYLGVFGPDRAEAFLMTFCLLAGYFSFAYGVRALMPRASPWTLVGNWLLQSFFLWSGFYNFYLGMALVPLVIGYYVRHAEDFGPKRATVVAFGLLALFFTHVIPTLVAVMTLGILAVWRLYWTGQGWKGLLPIGAAAIPVLALTALYASKSREAMKFNPDVIGALLTFPQTLFSYAAGRTGEQAYLWPAMLFLIVAAVVGMRRLEWRSAKGGLAVAAGVSFGLYLLLPDAGFGGSVVKMRFAWAMFLVGGLLVCTVARMAWLRTPIALYMAFFLSCQLATVLEHVRATSDGVTAYLAAMDNMTAGSRFVRLWYPAPAMRVRFGLDKLWFTPMLHVDSLAAVRRHAVDLSDYQSATGTFGVDYKPEVGDAQRYTLWGLEAPGMEGAKQLEWLRSSLPVKLDYVVLLGEENSPEAAATDMSKVLGELTAKETPVGVNPGAVFARVFRLR